MLLYSLFDRRLFNYCIIHYGKKGNTQIRLLLFNINILISKFKYYNSHWLFRWEWKPFPWVNCIDLKTEVCVWVVKLSRETLRPLQRTRTLSTAAIKSSPAPGAVKDGMKYVYILIIIIIFILHNQITNSAKYIFQMLILYILLLLLRLYRFPFSLKNIKREKQYRRSHPNINRIKSSLLMLYVSYTFLFFGRLFPVVLIRETTSSRDPAGGYFIDRWIDISLSI